MAKQTSVRFIFSPDGKTTTEQVEGVQGNQCELVTTSIEDALGVVTSRKPLMAFYADEETLEKLEEEDWRVLPHKPSHLETLEDEDWR